MSPTRKIVFIDTNIFLHFTFFTDIPWPSIVDAGGIVIVLPLITLKELDKHKYGQKNAVIKKRAEKVTKRLAELYRSKEEVRPGVRILFVPLEPDTEFQAYNLSRESQDDHLLASILRYRLDHPDEELLLITNDLALEVKAGYHKVETLSLPEEYRSPTEADPNERRVRELEQEIRELRARVPDLKLAFKGGAGIFTYTVPEASAPSTSVEAEMSAIRRQHRAISRDPILSLRYMPTEVDEYNQELSEFFEKYESYLEERSRVEELRQRAFSLEIRLINKGTSPAADIDVVMELPGEMLEVVGFDNAWLDLPEAPEPPQKPELGRRLRLSALSMRPYTPDLSALNGIGSELENVHGKSVSRREGNFRASFAIRNLKHGKEEGVVLHAAFRALEEARSFTIGCSISAANIPKEIRRSLHVVVGGYSVHKYTLICIIPTARINRQNPHFASVGLDDCI